MMKTIGIIGLGSIGYRHFKNLQDMGHRVLGFDPFKKEVSNASLGKIAREANAVVIAVPTELHYSYLDEVIMTMRKPFFIEKPIATKENVNFLITEAKISGLPMMVGYNLRYRSCVKKTKEWLDDRFIGGPLWSNFALAQWNRKPSYLRDGVILNWSHEIDLCNYLLGPSTVAGSSVRLSDNQDDMADILLTHSNGCRSTVHLDYLTVREQRKFCIVGKKGRITADIVNNTADLLMDNDLAESHQFNDTFNDNYIDEMQDFINLLDGKPSIGCSAEEGMETLKICLEVRKGAGLP